MSNYHIALSPGEIYHLYNRAVGNEKLFLSEDNYHYFLSKLKQHTSPIADVFAYALLPNHFHLVVRIKQEEDILQHFHNKKKKPFNPKENSLADFIMEQFSNWANGYVKAFNKMYNRKGGLFIDYMKRSLMQNDSDFTSYIFYVHKNAVHHGLTKKIGDWPYDSYNSLLSYRQTSLLREDVMEWFGSKERFIQFHQQPVAVKQIDIDI
ncbi:MAG: hypothetical protein KF825_07835 [Ferruginibacter sp.]|nr:hypothetical protein [Ferruginibacter sp.]